MSPLEKLYQHLEKVYHFQSIVALLSWDQETYMPLKAYEQRSQQMGLMASLVHQNKTSELKKILQDINLQELKDKDFLIVKRVKQDFEKWSKIPEKFAVKLSELTSQAQYHWDKAKKNNDFPSFAPYLQDLVKLKIEEANYLGYEDCPYDALLDDYEKGLKSKDFEKIIQPVVKEFYQKNTPTTTIQNPFHKNISAQEQLQFANQLIKDLGFDFTRGRQDLSSHPFSNAISIHDVRITTRIIESDLSYMLYSTIHETGHALYELGLNTELLGTPYSETCSLTIHESQSRFWENNIGRSRAFCKFLAKKLQEYLPQYYQEVNPEDLFAVLNEVKPSFIRTESDEVTYHLHIALRFELEKALINQEIKVEDLPALWNEKMKNYLGITPPNDSLGVLQDVHWSAGLLGYFPTYSLGSFYAAQIYQHLKSIFPHFDDKIEKGDFEFIHQWLKENIFSKGRLYNSQEILQQSTGNKLKNHIFRDYILTKIQFV
ncbi:MAG: carboxypeptidase M32 [Bacteroidia bacterium]|nr:MAG: carboxypeptidase M32 [Bacteroidia bacterium]